MKKLNTVEKARAEVIKLLNDYHNRENEPNIKEEKIAIWRIVELYEQALKEARNEL